MSLTFQQESIADCWDEFLVLARMHADSTMSYRRHEPFNPSRARYAAYEQMGMYRFLSARDAGRLVGYFGLYVTQSMHSQLPLVVEDIFFLHPDYRKGRNAIRFIHFMEAQARSWGTHELLFSCEFENTTARRLAEYLDYAPVIVQYSKRLPQSNQGPTAPHPSEELSHVCSEPSSPS